MRDIYALCEKLMAAGVTINRPPRDGHMAFIRSPDGISIELLQDGAPAAAGALGVDAQQRQLVDGHIMNFASDNAYGVLPQILAALADAAGRRRAGLWRGRGHGKADARFCELFERGVAVFPVISGTAANALALATLTPPHGAILCHEGSHIVGP